MSDKRKIGIYKITSPVNKFYFGQSWDIEKRWKHYKGNSCKKQQYLFNSFKKYGVDKHKFEIVYTFPEDIEQTILNEFEKFYFFQFKEANIELLNLREPTAQGKLSNETKDKIRVSMKLTIKKKRDAGFDFSHSEKTKQKIRLRRSFQVISEETKQKLSEAGKDRIPWNKGLKNVFHHTLNSKKKMSLIKQETWNNLSEEKRTEIGNKISNSKKKKNE